ncbi:MAG: hypothetical protein CMJ40_06615 [Phycisphaerae bacterium]|nr:hypothetical protein [Phycisphaerae bacterium]
MPRAPRFLASVIASLHNDLRFAPDKTKHRQMDAAEELMRDIHPERLYPLEYVVFRITRFRPDAGDLDATIVGSALIRDLGAFVQALSSDIAMNADQPRGLAIGIDEMARKLGVSRRTVQRYRGDGLILHWVRHEGGQAFLGCFPDALDHYLERSPAGMRRIRSWSRVDESERASILKRASQLHDKQEASLHSASITIAAETKRAVSTIRHVLMSAQRNSHEPIFSSHGPLTDRDAAICERSHAVGIPLSRVAARFQKSVPAVHRAMLRNRLRRLCRLRLDSVWQETFDRDDAEQVLLDFPAVHEDLPGPDSIIDLTAESTSPELEHGERLVVAIQMLLGRSERRLGVIQGQPTSRTVDSIESDIRWVGRLRGRLLERVIPTILQGCQQWLGRPLSELSRRSSLHLMTSCIEAIWPVIETLEPRMVDRLEARCLSAVDRLLTVRNPPRDLQAAARHEPGSLVLPWPVRSLVAWPWLEPQSEWATRIQSIGEEDQALIGMRWGLGGQSPKSIQAICECRGLGWTATQRRLHSIEVALRTQGSRSISNR